MLLIKVRKEGPTAGLTRTELNSATRATYRSMGEHWHSEFRPKHFTHQGAREYGYTPRQGAEAGVRRFARSYQGRKLKKYGHTLPLVKTGLSQKLAQIRDVRATSKGSRVVIHARTFNRSNPHSRINMREEVTAVSKPEEERLGQHGDGSLQRQINAIRRVKETSHK